MNTQEDNNTIDSTKGSLQSRIRSRFVMVLAVSVLWALAVVSAMAQLPPDFPNAPDQTPIDGGLVGVALGLGGWAIKKFRNCKR